MTTRHAASQRIVFPFDFTRARVDLCGALRQRGLGAPIPISADHDGADQQRGANQQRRLKDRPRSHDGDRRCDRRQHQEAALRGPPPARDVTNATAASHVSGSGSGRTSPRAAAAAACCVRR